MPKSIFLFNISDNFISLQKENNLEIVLDIFLKCSDSEFYKEQLKLIMGNLEINQIKNNLINYFGNRNNFINKENFFILHNKFKDEDEIIYFYDNYLKIIINDNNSMFIEYLSLYFVNLIAIEYEEEKIYPLHLVKNNILV